MDITEKAKEQLEKRIQKVEDFISERGVGASYLARARKLQRNLNIAIVMASVITLAGITVWAINKMDEED
jgi:hypothetical protein